MARPVHRHRKIRMDSTRAINKACWAANRPRKLAERARREARMLAMLKSSKSTDLHPALKSWICARLDKQWRQVTKDDLKALSA